MRVVLVAVWYKRRQFIIDLAHALLYIWPPVLSYNVRVELNKGIVSYSGANSMLGHSYQDKIISNSNNGEILDAQLSH